MPKFFRSPPFRGRRFTRRFRSRRFGQTALIRDIFANSTFGLGAVATPPVPLIQSWVERDDWQQSITETIQRKGILRAFKFDYTVNLQPLVTGGVYTTQMNAIWAVGCGDITTPNPDLDAGPGTLVISSWWAPGGAFAGGTGRLLRHGTFGFTWNAPSATFVNPPSNSPIRIRGSWKGRHALGFDDSLFIIFQKQAPTGDQANLATMLVTGVVQSWVSLTA